MSAGLQELRSQDLNAALERVLVPQLAAQLCTRGPGHCMRVTDLDRPLMRQLCQQLRTAVPDAQIVVLDPDRQGKTDDLTVTSTKLVELRNPLADGSLRPPLLVFIPNDVRAAAEDSFGVATFEALSLGNVYERLIEELLAETPNGLRNALAEILRRLQAASWPFAGPVAQARYLLTAKINDYDPDAAGAALFELGLVPDFALFHELARVPAQVDRNRECVRTLTWSSQSERGRVLTLGLVDRAFRAQLAEFLTETGLEDPRGWTRRIVLEREHWGLSFHRWPFAQDAAIPTGVFIEVTELGLPTVSDGEVNEPLCRLLGQRYLPVGPQGWRQFSVTFRVHPPPHKLPGIKQFVLEVLSQQTGVTGLTKRIKAWQAAKAETTVTFSKVHKIDWEEGWHFVRVQAVTADDDLVPLVDAQGNPLSWSEGDIAGRRPNESDLFYVLTTGEVEVEPIQQAIPRDLSLLHAQRRLQFAALLEGRRPADVIPREVRWRERTERTRTTLTDFLEVKFGREGTVHIPISHPLKVLEQKLLAAPETAVEWQLPLRSGQAGSSVATALTWPQTPATAPFLAARARYFEALRAGDRELLTQAADLQALRPLIIAYAEAYAALLVALLQRAESDNDRQGRQALTALRQVLTLDTVTLALSDSRGNHREAVLVAPTHPLRALWLGTWAALGDHWLQSLATGKAEQIVPAREALLHTLAPLNFPPVLARSGGQLLTAVDNLNPFWTLYTPTRDPNPRGLVGEVCAALELPEPAIGGMTIDGSYLASRIERYLLQHPYVRTLVLNAFNPGRATLLADLLLSLQKQPAFAQLRYEIRLFVPDPTAAAVGDSLLELLSPSTGPLAEEAAAFATPGVSHLYPKLSLAVRATAEFQANPAAHPAHVSLLFDVFPAGDLAVAPLDDTVEQAPVHGLYQDFAVSYREDEQSVIWRRQPRHGVARPLPGAEELTDLLATVPRLFSTAAAVAATGQAGMSIRPVIILALNGADRTLLYQAHDVSDWVITIDRNLGIEFFDHGGKAGRSDYLIDHSPDLTSTFSHKLIITSRSLEELEALLRPALQEYGFPIEGSQAVAFLEQLRSLSGRLAFKLLSAPNQRAEAIGLALARLYLEYQGVLQNQLLVPLDAHLELYRTLQKQAEELGDALSFKRSDLALFDLDAANRVMTCRLVEVKCYTGMGDASAYHQLKETIAAQIAQSEQVLARHFDPHSTPRDRPDRLLKTRELVVLLEFYLDRAVRYGWVDQATEAEARSLLHTLEQGYRLGFTRSALIFDFAKPGTEPAETEAGIEFHRIGQDLIQELVAATAATRLSRAGAADQDLPPEQEYQRGSLTQITLPVPRLQAAAFLSSPRERTLAVLATATIDTEETLPVSSVDSTLETASDAAVVRGQEAGGTAAGQAPAMLPLTAATTQLERDTTEQVHPVPYDILLGTTRPSPQYGILGEIAGRKVAIDLNETHTISLFGVQGGGKSYTLGMIAEMATQAIAHVNRLPQPLATIIFHYSPTQDYPPEFTSMVAPNTDEGQLAILRERYQADPLALLDVGLLVPADKLTRRQQEYPHIPVYPLKFTAAELQASHWRFLMGAVGNQSTYIRQLNRIMRECRHTLSLEALRQGIDHSRLPDHLKELAHQRLELAAGYIDDSARLGDLIRPGRLLIVDLRDEFIEKDEALGLFVVLLQLFADARYQGKSFNKLVVFDEAHKYIESPDLIAGLIEVVREMRHKGTSILVASQDPPSVPIALIELSSQIILHRFNSPAWLKHLQKANAALAVLTPERMAHLTPGDAYIWSSKATDEGFSKGVVKIRCRPRVTQHGGSTRTAV